MTRGDWRNYGAMHDAINAWVNRQLGGLDGRPLPSYDFNSWWNGFDGYNTPNDERTSPFKKITKKYY